MRAVKNTYTVYVCLVDSFQAFMPLALDCSVKTPLNWAGFAGYFIIAMYQYNQTRLLRLLNLKRQNAFNIYTVRSLRCLNEYMFEYIPLYVLIYC